MLAGFSLMKNTSFTHEVTVAGSCSVLLLHLQLQMERLKIENFERHYHLGVRLQNEVSLAGFHGTLPVCA